MFHMLVSFENQEAENSKVDNYRIFENVYIFYFRVNRHDYLFPIHGLEHDNVISWVRHFIIVFVIIIILFLLLSSNYFGRKCSDFVSIANLQMNFFSFLTLKNGC